MEQNTTGTMRTQDPPAQEETTMADDKTKRGRQDRARVARTEAYEVHYFARKHGLTREQAEEILRQAGSSRRKANELAERLKSGSAPTEVQSM